ncbi:MAG: type IV secretion system protein VirJ [Pseudomonadota bacterium]|nr:type IV secretion system protein VirJ [Pseudomonadota bacterium]
MKFEVPLRSVRAVLLLAVAVAAVLIRAAMPPIGPRVPVVQAGGLEPAAGAPARTAVSEQQLSHGRFANLTVYVPGAAPRGFILLLSGTGGWTPVMSDAARGLAAKGAMVVGIDLAQLNQKLEADGAQCVFPDGDLENLSHFTQAFYHLPTYLSPVIAGYDAGATLAYAVLAQAPTDTFAGAVSVGFCPDYASSKSLCKGSGLEYRPHPGGGVDFLPSKHIGNSWLVVPTADEAGRDTERCDAATVRSFVDQVPGAEMAPVAHMSVTSPPGWFAPFSAAVDTLLVRSAPTAAIAPSALADLPVIALPARAAAAASDTFAIMLSGDGGWAGLDKDVAGALAADGISVIGLDSLRYFWTARTPEGLAADVDRMIRYYLMQLGKQRVVLIGYSQGADVLPFAVNRLSPASRGHVALLAIMGMSEHALFEFHVSSWLGDDNSGPATLPEVEKVTGIPVTCIYGAQESDSLCPQLDPHKFTVVKLAGGHHFDGDYAGLARAILASAMR